MHRCVVFAGRSCGALLMSLSMACVAWPTMAAADDLSKGIAEYKDESFEEAAASLEKVYARESGNYEAVFYLGMSYLKMLEFEKARAYLLEASRLHPADSMPDVYLGEALFSLQDYAAAEKVLQRTINNGVESARAYYFLGLTRFATGKYRESLNGFGRAEQLDARTRVKATYMTGMAYRKMGDAESSAVAFREVIRLAPASEESARAEQWLNQPLPKKYLLSASLTEQFDSNVVLKPARNVSGLTVTRSRDYVTTAAVNASFGDTLDDNTGFSANYGFSQSMHSKLSFYDVQTHHIEFTPYLMHGPDQSFMVVNLDSIGVDYRRYMLGFGVMPGYVHDFAYNQQVVLLAGYQRKIFFWPDASTADNRDASNSQIGLTYIWNVPQAGVFGRTFQEEGRNLSATYVIDREKADGMNWSYIGQRLSLSGNYPVRDGVHLNLAADHYRQRYQNINTFYGVHRYDMSTTLSSVLEWKPVQRASLKASYSFTRVLSNISVYDYRRNLGSLSFEYRY